jgi:hypothetical protein
MKNIFLSIQGLMLFSVCLFAQERPADLKPNDHFIYLLDNTLLREGEFEIKNNLLSKRFSYSNGDKIKLAEIKYFQDNKGYFAVLPGGYGTAKRTESGKVDLFTRYDYQSTGTGGTMRTKSYLYAIGFGDLKSLKYKNLSNDLVLDLSSGSRSNRNYEVLRYLEKGRTTNIVSNSMLAGGMGIFLGGLIAYSSAEKRQDASAQGTALIVSTVGMVTAVVSLGLKPQKSYLRAVRAYNKLF